MKHRLTAVIVAILACAFLVIPADAWAQDLALDPMSWDAGEVELGTTASQTFTLTSVGLSTAVWVYVIVVQPTGDGTSTAICGDGIDDFPEDGVEEIECDFQTSIGLDAFPITLDEGEALDVDVTFAPTVLGDQEAYLFIQSNDADPPPGPQAWLPLTGTGAEPPVADDPATLLADLLDDIDGWVDAGELWGTGPGRSARHRLAAFIAMLEGAAFLIDRDADGLACLALAVARAKADGEPRPPDFVAGPAAADVVVGIHAVMAALGCGGHGCNH